jgi:urease accessory protein
MRRLVRAAKAGRWPIEEAADGLTLGFEERRRRRVRLVTDGGEAVLLDLGQAVALDEGDGLAFEDGGWLAVHAAPEDVLDIEAADPEHLARLAWHLGNRHLPVQALEGKLRVRDDHVIADMIEKLGGRVTRLSAPFDPETGAYAGVDPGQGHGHDH